MTCGCTGLRRRGWDHWAAIGLFVGGGCSSSFATDDRQRGCEANLPRASNARCGVGAWVTGRGNKVRADAPAGVTPGDVSLLRARLPNAEASHQSSGGAPTRSDDQTGLAEMTRRQVGVPKASGSSAEHLLYRDSMEGGVCVPKGVRLYAAFPGQAGSAVNEGKEQFLSFLDAENMRRFGFDTKPTDQEVRLLEGLSESFVSVAELRAFNPLAQVDAKRWEVDRIVYPVVTDGKVRAAITIAVVDGTWRPVAYGQVPLIRAVMAAKFKALSVAVLKSQAVQYRILTVFGLNEQFLAAFPLKATTQFWLIPIRTRHGFEAGAPEDSLSVLAKLQTAAQALTGKGPT